MKRTQLILVAFLMCLYLGPPIFTASYVNTAISSDNNTGSGFSLSDDWNEVGNISFGLDLPEWNTVGPEVAWTIETGFEESPQSIEGFEETLPDDVLHYPDGLDGLGILASGGYYEPAYGEDYDESWVLDGTACNMSNTENIEFLYFGGDFNITIDYHFYLIEISSQYSVIRFYNWVEAEYDAITGTIGDTVPQWYNGTISNAADYINSTGYIRCAIGLTEYPSTVGIDSAYLDIYFETESGSYYEPFRDVSAWSPHANFAHADDTITSDGDVMIKSNDWGGSTDYDYIYDDSMSVDTSSGTWYYEFRFKCTDLDGDTAFLYLRDENGASSGNLQGIDTSENVNWETYKGLVTLDSVEQITIGAIDDDSDSVQYLEYINIYPANEGGWQHDGSTTEGVYNDTDSEVTYLKSSDGDKLTLNATADVGYSSGIQYPSFYIRFDTTSTIADMDSGYYPFLEMNFDLSCVSTAVSFDVAIDGYRSNPLSVLSEGTSQTIRYNLAAKPNTNIEAVNLGIWVFALFNNAGDSFELTMDNAKLYSIANYTVTQSGTSIDDVLYVEDGVLICSGTSFTDITLDRDPPLSLERPYYGWRLNSSSVAPEIDFYDDEGYWLGYSAESEGELLYNRTYSDVRLKFTESGNIISITFFDSSYWRDIVTVYFWIRVKSWVAIISNFVIGIFLAFFTGSLDAFLILIGLILIPVSVLYLAKGGRDEISFDKVAIFCVVIFLGIGLFIGGIMP